MIDLFQLLTKLVTNRSERPNSETSPNQPTPVSFAGSSFSSSSSAPLAHGSSHIYALSSSSKNLLRGQKQELQGIYRAKMRNVGCLLLGEEILSKRYGGIGEKKIRYQRIIPDLNFGRSQS
jgi:hypothetical protein